MKTAWREVLRECLALVQPLGTERVERRRAQGRVLAEDICADRDYPAGDLSMMDGYALNEERRESYMVDGENTPGAGGGAPLATSHARRIFTGAELPPGATRVVPQEVVRREGEKLVVEDWPTTTFVRPRGREARQGDIVLARGTSVGAIELAVLATMGCREAEVFRQPTVFRLATGDEIASPDEPLSSGKIRDSNGDLIAGLMAGAGFPSPTQGRVTDDREEVFRCVADAASRADFLLISGGASVGDHDHARAALEAAGFHFLAHGLNVRPGRPVGLARRGEKWAVALPGNPLSHLASMRLLVLPLLRASAGERGVEPQLIRALLDGEINREVPKRDTFWPATITLRDGLWHARPGRFLSSGDLIGTTGINGLMHLPTGQTVPAVGEAVEILLLAGPFA